MSFKIVSEEYFSNCLFAAIWHKIKNPHIKLYYCPRCEDGSKFHVMWDDGLHSYDFADVLDEYFIGNPLLYKGAVREFRQGFAKRYRNLRRSARKRTK